MERNQRTQIVRDLKNAVQQLSAIESLQAEVQKKQNEFDEKKKEYEKFKMNPPTDSMTPEEEREYFEARLIEYRKEEPYNQPAMWPAVVAGFFLVQGGLGLLFVLAGLLYGIITEGAEFTLTSIDEGTYVPVAVDAIVVIICIVVLGVYFHRNNRASEEQEERAYNRAESDLRSKQQNRKNRFEYYTAVLKKYPSVKEKFEKEIQRLLSELRNSQVAFLQTMEHYGIPENFRNGWALKYISDCFENGAVDSFKEAYNRLMDKQESDGRVLVRAAVEDSNRIRDQLAKEAKESEHRRKMEYEARRQSESAAKAAEELRRMNEKLNSD